MAAPISSITSILPPIATGSPKPPAAGGEFQNLLGDAISRLQSAETNANQAAQRFLTGESEELHTVALATQQASLAFELGLSVRNKVVEAYQEVMRMQL